MRNVQTQLQANIRTNLASSIRTLLEIIPDQHNKVQIQPVRLFFVIVIAVDEFIV